ncbi:MAG: response regulator [Opitutaceae bacterium]|nr:response regulator [Opitutaceae bacterium]
MTEAPLRFLIIEDDETDAELIARHLRRDGLALEFVRVENEPTLRDALSNHAWDVIIADYTQPTFNAFRALEIYAEYRLDIPFIIISGTVGEEVAVEAMRAGAHDYLLKDKLTRLGPLIRRELRESKTRIERRKTEAALRESEERFRLLVENTNDLIAEVSATGLLLYASPNHFQILAYPPRELVGRSVYDTVHQDDRQIIVDRLTARDGSVFNYRVIGKDGVTHWLESSGRSFRTSSGEERIVVISRDVTERMQANEKRAQLEAQLRQSQKMEAIGTLAGGIAHDFNNILTGIIGNIQLAQIEAPPGHLVTQPLQDALSASYRARDLVSQILTFSRRHEQRRSPGDIGAIAKEALRLLRSSLPASISIETQINEGCPKVLCDPTQIHQVIMNLGTNAAHAMKERGGLLRVAVDRVCVDGTLRPRYPQLSEGLAVRLTVADTGMGIPQQNLERIFEPFFTTKPVGEGTGLGLAVVHGIVQSHDAAVTVDSAVGKGTSFSIYFPPVEGRSQQSAAPHETAPKGFGQQVMLVDDEPGVVSLGSRMLEKLNYRPLAFTQASVALKAIQEKYNEIDVLITDLAMPEMSGLDLARQFLTLKPTAVIIVSTGMMRALDRDNADSIGIRFAINKPFTFADFATTLSKALKDQGKN